MIRSIVQLVVIASIFACFASATTVVMIDPERKMNIGENVGWPNITKVAHVPPSFLAFSIEISSIMFYFDEKKMKPRPWFVQLLRNLQEKTGVVPRIRLGGNSADWSWYNPSGKPKPPNIVYDEKETFFKSLKALSDEVKVQYYFGVNFLSGYDPTNALNEVKAISMYLGWENIYAIQLGNEPDVYGGHYRSPGYTFAQYQIETHKYRDAIRSVDNNIPYEIFSGPDFCCPGRQYYENGPDFVKSNNNEYKNYGFHIYPLSACGGNKVTMQELLSDKSVSIKDMRIFKSIAKAAVERKKEWIISETNNICCEGYQGVSDTFASALWALDFMFSAATLGPSAMHFHASGFSYYTPIIIDKTGKNPDFFRVMPIYYAFLMWNTAIQQGSSLLHTNSTSSESMTKIWSAIDDNDQTIRVVIIQKDMNCHKDTTVTIQIPSDKYSAEGEIILLKGVDYVQSSNVTIAGQTFDNSKDGKPHGERIVTTLKAKSPRVFDILLPPASAILFSVKLQSSS